MELKVGMKVQVVTERASNGWGRVKRWDIGILRVVQGEYINIDFPNHRHWNGKRSEVIPIIEFKTNREAKSILSKDF